MYTHIGVGGVHAQTLKLNQSEQQNPTHDGLTEPCHDMKNTTGSWTALPLYREQKDIGSFYTPKFEQFTPAFHLQFLKQKGVGHTEIHGDKKYIKKNPEATNLGLLHQNVGKINIYKSK